MPMVRHEQEELAFSCLFEEAGLFRLLLWEPEARLLN